MNTIDITFVKYIQCEYVTLNRIVNNCKRFTLWEYHLWQIISKRYNVNISLLAEKQTNLLKI